MDFKKGILVGLGTAGAVSVNDLVNPSSARSLNIAENIIVKDIPTSHLAHDVFSSDILDFKIYNQRLYNDDNFDFTNRYLERLHSDEASSWHKTNEEVDADLFKVDSLSYLAYDDEASSLYPSRTVSVSTIRPSSTVSERIGDIKVTPIVQDVRSSALEYDNLVKPIGQPTITKEQPKIDNSSKARRHTTRDNLRYIKNNILKEFFILSCVGTTYVCVNANERLNLTRVVKHIFGKGSPEDLAKDINSFIDGMLSYCKRDSNLKRCLINIKKLDLTNIAEKYINNNWQVSDLVKDARALQDSILEVTDQRDSNLKKCLINIKKLGLTNIAEKYINNNWQVSDLVKDVNTLQDNILEVADQKTTIINSISTGFLMIGFGITAAFKTYFRKLVAFLKSKIDF